MSKLRRLSWRLFCLLLVSLPLFASAPTVTRIQDVLYRADGQPATGTLVISWPAFVTAEGVPIAAGSRSITVGADGRFDVTLVPTSNARTRGVRYQVVFHQPGNKPAAEAWNIAPSSTSLVGARVLSESSGSGQTVDVGLVRYASEFAGDDWGQKINAAIANLPFGGTVRVCTDNSLAQISTSVVIPPTRGRVHLEFCGGGVFTLADNATISVQATIVTIDFRNVPLKFGNGSGIRVGDASNHVYKWKILNPNFQPAEGKAPAYAVRLENAMEGEISGAGYIHDFKAPGAAAIWRAGNAWSVDISGIQITDNHYGLLLNGSEVNAFTVRNCMVNRNVVGILADGGVNGGGNDLTITDGTQLEANSTAGLWIKSGEWKSVVLENVYSELRSGELTVLVRSDGATPVKVRRLYYSGGHVWKAAGASTAFTLDATRHAADSVSATFVSPEVRSGDATGWDVAEAIGPNASGLVLDPRVITSNMESTATVRNTSGGKLSIVQKHLTGDLDFFAANSNIRIRNGNDTGLNLSFYPGKTVDSDAMFTFHDHLGNPRWRWGRHAGNTFALNDPADNYRVRFSFNSGGNTTINSAGAGGVMINGWSSTGTGGLFVCNGAASPVCNATVDSSGKATFKAVVAPSFQATLATPATSSQSCVAGQMWADVNFVYVCTATDTIKRATLSAF